MKLYQTIRNKIIEPRFHGSILSYFMIQKRGWIIMT